MSKTRWPVARVEYTTHNITTDEEWARITIAPLTSEVWAPARQAETIVALVNDAHSHLQAALEALTGDDPSWRDHISRAALATDELQRMGRPRQSKEEVVRLADRRGTDEACRRYGITPGTIDRYRSGLKKLAD